MTFQSRDVSATLYSVMWRRSLLAALLLAMLAVVPLAYASPPDQTWIGGWYDDGDYDDAVITITATVALVHAAPHVEVRPVALVVGVAPLGDDRAVPGLRSAPRQPRAPPLA